MLIFQIYKTITVFCKTRKYQHFELAFHLSESWSLIHLTSEFILCERLFDYTHTVFHTSLNKVLSIIFQFIFIQKVIIKLPF